MPWLFSASSSHRDAVFHGAAEKVNLDLPMIAWFKYKPYVRAWCAATIRDCVIRTGVQMRLFIDSSDPDLWAKYRRAGWAFGATTNPLILQKDRKGCSMDTYAMLVRQASTAGLKELQIQATGETVAELVQSGKSIAALWDQVVVKIPMTPIGLAAASALKTQGTKITLTAAYATHQMIAASAMGTDYIAPYYGRLIEAGKDADMIVDAMLAITGPRVLVASIRTIEQLEKLAMRGHDTFTLNPELCVQLGQSKMSDKAAADFETASKS